MEHLITEIHQSTTDQNQDVNKTESAENFQKFIYELFDKNGILNDLRAYLRGHIVNVLKNAQTGDPPSCQKHFTQRLEYTFQALNMLVAEYLLCLEFNYSLSVFVSEIPLANMVFDFAKSLMDLGADGEAAGLRFRKKDVWSILNYLGVKCDSEHAQRIVEMYETEVKSPLLLCILKCVELCDSDPHAAEYSEEGSISTSSKSSNTDHEPSTHAQCKHYACCRACRRRYRRLKDKYREKKKHYIQVFEELKTVYDTEMHMFKVEHESKIKNSLASHVKHFQRMKNELEETFRVREAELETNIVNKKRFLWGLAQALRVQHSQMSRAMQAVKKQTAELADQEQNLKAQRTEAEESLKKHAEEMRQQIADELMILERHLESLKTERESMNRERIQHDTVQSETKIDTDVKDYLQTHYHLLKDELNVLKMYIENATFRPKCVVERGTITDDFSCRGMNNETARVVREEVRPNQLVNNLKKQKNVNFSSHMYKFGESRDDQSGSSSSDDLSQSRAGSDRPRPFPRQQAQISLIPADTLVHLQAGMRPHVPVVPRIGRSMSESITESGWQKGAGEERGLLASTRILVPGDALPFVGLAAQRRSDGRRHLLNRWRTLRRRVSPLGGAELSSHSVHTAKPAECVGIRIHSPSSDPTRDKGNINQPEEAAFTPTRDNSRAEETTVAGSKKTREKSPRSLLKEAKEKLKTVTRESARREKSPSAMLREAKLRLRKLEIEAEAVARSYKDFRRRQDLRNPDCAEQSSIPYPVSKLETHHRDEMPEHSRSQLPATNSMTFDFDKYLKKYQIDLEMGQDRFKNRNTAAVQKNPVPKAYSEVNRKVEPTPKHDYLEKSILEFRKLYYTNPTRIHASSSLSREAQEPLSELDIDSDKALDVKSEMRDEKNNKQKELNIHQQNYSTVYDLEDEPTKDTVETKHNEEINVVENLLTVEVENVSEVRNLKIVSSEADMILVVEGSLDSKEIVSEQDNDKTSMKTTIIISPKKIDESKDADRPSMAPSPHASFTISNANKENVKATGDEDYSKDIQIEIRSDTPGSELQIEARQGSDTDEQPDDYPDDLSFDVDNYKSEYDVSPISLPKNSEDENFWD